MACVREGSSKVIPWLEDRNHAITGGVLIQWFIICHSILGGIESGSLNYKVCCFVLTGLTPTFVILPTYDGPWIGKYSNDNMITHTLYKSCSFILCTMHITGFDQPDIVYFWMFSLRQQQAVTW